MNKGDPKAKTKVKNTMVLKKKKKNHYFHIISEYS